MTQLTNKRQNTILIILTCNLYLNNIFKKYAFTLNT